MTHLITSALEHDIVCLKGSVNLDQIADLLYTTERTAHQNLAQEGVPRVKRHTKATHANCTPATDGTHVVANFGSEGLFCYDRDGRLLWRRELGRLNSSFRAIPAFRMRVSRSAMGSVMTM